jgi:hypothetical protein
MASTLLRSVTTLVLLSGLAGTTAAHAQHFSLAPQIGFYIPTDNLTEVLASGDAGKLEAGPSFGARIGLWFGKRFGIEASGAYIPTTFTLPVTGGNIETHDAKLFNGSGQAVFYILPATGVLSLYVSGGVGVISRGGIAFTSEAQNTDVSGVLGAGAGFRLGGVTLTAGVDLFSYKAEYAGSDQTSSELQQHDIHLKLGLGIPFGGK